MRDPVTTIVDAGEAVSELKQNTAVPRPPLAVERVPVRGEPSVPPESCSVSVFSVYVPGPNVTIPSEGNSNGFSGSPLADAPRNAATNPAAKTRHRVLDMSFCLHE